VVKVKTSLKLLFSVSFWIIEVKYDNLSKAVLELVLGGQVLNVNVNNIAYTVC